MSNQSHEVIVTDLEDGFSYVMCHQTKLHRTVMTDRVPSEISALDDECQTDHERLDVDY